jgi:hypothetical protein
MFPKLGKKPKTAREIYAEALRKPRAKYGNTRSLCALGHSHRSKLESSVCALIQLREKAGELHLVRAESTVYLTAARIAYIVDFECMDLKTKEPLYIEAKGAVTAVFAIKRRLWKHFGPGRLEIWKGDWRHPALDEFIIPKGPL